MKEPFPGFYKRLKSFVSNVQVNDAMSEEEKYMIIKRTRKKKLLQENKKPTFSKIQVFKFVILEENKSLLI